MKVKPEHTNYFLPWFTTIVKIFVAEPGLHELYILQPQIETNISLRFTN